MTQSFHNGPTTDDSSVLRAVLPLPTEKPFVYTVKDAYDAFEWLRRQPDGHAVVALHEWRCLFDEVARLTESLAAAAPAARRPTLEPEKEDGHAASR